MSRTPTFSQLQMDLHMWSHSRHSYIFLLSLKSIQGFGAMRVNIWMYSLLGFRPLQQRSFCAIMLHRIIISCNIFFSHLCNLICRYRSRNLSFLCKIYFLLTPPKRLRFCRLSLCLSVSNFAQKLCNRFARNFQGRLAMGQ